MEVYLRTGKTAVDSCIINKRSAVLLHLRINATIVNSMMTLIPPLQAHNSDRILYLHYPCTISYGVSLAYPSGALDTN